LKAERDLQNIQLEWKRKREEEYKKEMERQEQLKIERDRQYVFSLARN
jgi:hypothetical protein